MILKGTAIVLRFNDHSTLYAVSFRYPGADADEVFEIPEQRLLVMSDAFIKSRSGS